ncbi:perlucin-like protein [Mytilus galloprovincialis]|uniref:perlucin-like protein n=1 Tax=Mytilus galloprovincialis TaxID=29158 RepID=UPI003F7B995A
MLALYLLAVVICLSEAEKCFQEKEAKLINGIKASLKTMKENMKGVHQMVEKLEVNIKEKSNICKKGWKEYKDHCYKYQNDKKSWRMAEKQCRTMGGYLVKIEDVSEHNWVVQNIKGGNLGSTWIGASDAGKKDWRWAFDLSKVTYSLFNPGQPDNGGNVEGCLEVRSVFGYKWNDFPCSSTNSYVCESQQGVSCQPYSKLLVKR